jgi:hypothetical protein
MLSFGAFFGNTVMTRLAVFLERVEFPLHDGLRLIKGTGKSHPLKGYNLTNGWISLRDSPTQSLLVEYEFSTRLEMFQSLTGRLQTG